MAPERYYLGRVASPPHEGVRLIRDRISCAQQDGIRGMYVTGCGRAALVANDCADREDAMADICTQRRK